MTALSFSFPMLYMQKNKMLVVFILFPLILFCFLQWHFEVVKAVEDFRLWMVMTW